MVYFGYMKFTDFNLDSGLQEGLADAGYITCMPVQEQVLQNGLEGADLYVQSQTGTGKTAAYLLTILQRLISDPALAGKKALIMVPTRELAVQVEEEARILAAHTKMKSASFYGGVAYAGQQNLLAKGVDVIVGTPGRVIDLQQSGTMNLKEVAFLVIDEADRMFDMGFYPDLRVLIKVLPPAEQRQTMLFSATLNATVKNLAWEYTVNAKEVTIESENVTVTEIEQILYHVSSDEKMKLLLGILKNEQPDSLLIFCNTKRMSEVVAKRLKINGYEADFIIGDLPQSKRLQVIDSFKSGSLKCLVATDVAARGIDVNDLAMVINYDLPNEAENYVHRTGRTARAGKTGKAYTFCSEQDVYNLPSIQKYIEAKLESSVASEDMMVEDKSAHMYIRTDRYDNDYADDDRGSRRSSGGRPSSSTRDRGPRSAGPRSSGPRSSGPRTGGQRPLPSRSSTSHESDSQQNRAPRGERSRTSAPRPSSAPRGDDTRNQGGNRNDSSYRNDPRPQNAPPKDERNSAEKDLSKLSFEERMSYYKNKYGAEETAKDRARNTKPPARGENQRSESSGQGDGKNRQGSQTRRPKSPAQQGGPSRSSGPKTGEGQRGENGRVSSPRGRNAPQQRTNAKPSNAKPGIASASPQQSEGMGVGIGGFFRRLFKKK